MMIEDISRPTWPITFAKTASAISLVLGALIILSWMFYFWLSDTIIPLVVAFKPNTALCFILSGIALWIRCEKSEGAGYPHYLAEICTGFVFLICFLTLFEYSFDIDLGIDQGLFKVPLGSETMQTFSPPGRMSPFSAVSFIFLSFVLFFLDNKTVSYRVHQTFTILVLALSFFELIGHIYQIGTLGLVFGIRRNKK